MVLSEEPLTTKRSLYWRQAMPRLWPFKVLTNSQVEVLQTLVQNKKILKTSIRFVYSMESLLCV